MMSKLRIVNLALTRINASRNYGIFTNNVLILKSGTSNQQNSYDKGQHRNFKNFGHKPIPEPFVSKLWYAFLTTTFFLCCLDWNW